MGKARKLKIAFPPRRRKATPEERERLVKNTKPFWWKKGVSGNPSGRPKGFVTMASIARQIALSDATLDEIVRVLFNRKRPDLQVKIWGELLNRGFGQSPQAVFMRAVLTGDDSAPLFEGGDAVDVTPEGKPGGPAPYVIDPEDPAQVERATRVAKSLIKLALSSGISIEPQGFVDEDKRNGTPRGSNRNGDAT